MSSQEDKFKNYYEILELDENATLADINRAYKQLTELYSTESIVTDPILDEFGEDEREEIVRQLEEAYKALILYIVQRDRAQKIPTEDEKRLEDTAEEEFPLIEEDSGPDPQKEISDIVAETKKEIEEEEEVILLQDVLPNEESIKTIIAPPTATFPSTVSTPPAPSTPPEPLTLPESELQEVTQIQQEIPEEINHDSIYVHENNQDHEPIHIELPEKEEEEILEDGFKIIDDEEESEGEAVLEEVESQLKVPTRKGIWDESLFAKDINDIKKEITRDLTQDIRNQLTVAGADTELTEQTQVLDETEGVLIKGRTLRKFREKLGMGIHEMAISTKIHYKILVNIEKERFAKLPDPGYLRWYLMTYAKRLALDPKRVADEYMRRYRQWEKEQKGFS